MIRQVSLRRFKQFAALDVKLPGHVVLAGPNNGGKTTVLQAIAAWDLAFRRWREMNDLNARNGYVFCPIARPDFLAVPLPLNSLDLMWTGRERHRDIEITIGTAAWSLTMELRFDNEQVLVRPRWHDTSRRDIEAVDLRAVYVPPMGGLASEEPYYAIDAFLEGRFAEGRPGEVLRNLLFRAAQDQETWPKLTGIVRRLFGYELEMPRAGRFLSATYKNGGKSLDLVSSGSGFQQVLMLATMLVTRPGSVLLVDEPDAHLHMILQDAIFHELHSLAKASGAQLIVSTHSEVIINSVDVGDLLVMPSARPLGDDAERKCLVRSLGMISNTDLMLARSAPGVLYVEGHTDLDLLRAWAAQLQHPALEVLENRLFWHSYSIQSRPDAPGFAAREHFKALQLMVPHMKGLEIQDRDGNPNLPETVVAGSGLQVVRWRRYEVESYLLSPAAIERFVAERVGAAGAAAAMAKMGDLLTADYVKDPSKSNRPAEAVMESDKARTKLLPPILDAGGLLAFPYTRFHEIAAQMLPAEIHPEVREKLDAICAAFGIPFASPPDAGSNP